MIDEYAHGEDETDRLEDEWHARMMPMTQTEIDAAIKRNIPPLWVSRGMYSVDDELDYGCHWAGIDAS